MNRPLQSVFIRAIRHECEGVASFQLESPDRSPLPAYAPGAHVDVQLPSGVMRSYSLLEPAPGCATYRIAVKREPESRGGSLWLHETARVGHTLQICEPANDFALVEDAPVSVFVAGGIGITPLLAMIQHLDALARRWELHYAASSRAGMPFRDTLERLAARGQGLLRLHFSEDKAGRMDLARIVAAAPKAAHFYCCGPSSMIDAFLDATHGRPPEQVHHERFAASQSAATTGGFSLKLARDGRVLMVPAGKSVLDVLLDAGYDVPYSCTQGVCGSCRVDVVDGVPDHRDDYLTDTEKQANDCMLVCCSGSRSQRLVLDL
jgi:vanillate O-demethylase ferredoxin subunit